MSHGLEKNWHKFPQITFVGGAFFSCLRDGRLFSDFFFGISLCATSQAKETSEDQEKADLSRHFQLKILINQKYSDQLDLIGLQQLKECGTETSCRNDQRLLRQLRKKSIGSQSCKIAADKIRTCQHSTVDFCEPPIAQLNSMLSKNLREIAKKQSGFRFLDSMNNDPFIRLASSGFIKTPVFSTFIPFA
jgi:hypothetical protein